MEIFLVHLGFVLLLIGVHEFGHYVVARLGGIPSNNVRIRWLAFPQYVSIKHKERWLAPDDTEAYVVAVWHYLKTRPRVYLYVSGGFLLETVFTSILFSIFWARDLDLLATALIRMSVAILLPWLLIDLVMIIRQRIVGDFSALWQLSTWPTALLMGAMIAIRVFLFSLLSS